MPDLTHLLVFLAACVVLNLTPGPDVVYVTSTAIRSGVRAGVVAALGVSTGCLVHITVAALGLAALIAASPAIFGALKWVGAVYLFWIGVQKLRAAASGANALAAGGNARGSPDSHPAPVWHAAFRGGFLTNALNPKVALFFLAFMPQFIAPGSVHPALVFVVLGLLFALSSLGVNTLWALAAAWATRRGGVLRRAARWLDGIAGVAFVGFGLELALSHSPGAESL